MMDWETYAILLDMEQKERARKGEPPLFDENQEELLKEENQKISKTT